MMQPFSADFSWQPHDINIILPVAVSTFSFEIYWFTARSEKIKSLFYKRFKADDASAYHITFLRIFGFLAMGLVSGLLCQIFLPDYSLSDYGLRINPETTLFSFFWIVALVILIIPLTFVSARTPANLDIYPQIRARLWTKKIAVLNIVSWIIYLLGYEFLFRGILLFPLAGRSGVWPAIAINIAFYSITHVPKGLNETIGAIILGLVLCILTLVSGTIWIAFIVHVAMALTNSFTALKYQPEMQFKRTIKWTDKGLREKLL